MKNPLPCIVCGRENDPAMGEYSGVNQPYNATAFVTRGHYGSTIFDPIDEPVELTITVCDPCLIAASERGDVLILPEHGKAETWQPHPESAEYARKVASEAS